MDNFNVIEAIERRVSTRNFKKETFDYKNIENFIAELNKEDIFNFKIVNTTSNNVKVGTYGAISGAEVFLAGSIKTEALKDDSTYVKFGEVFEKIILYITAQGLDTCWLGGTYNSKQAKETFKIGDNYTLFIVSPVGIRNEKDRFFDKVLNMAIKPRSRKEFNTLFFENDFNTPLKENDKYAAPLKMVQLAPSAKNSQPWRVIKVDNRYDFYGNVKNLKNISKAMAYNDIGIAKAHFELTANELGLVGKWDTLINCKDVDNLVYFSSWVEQ